jgi:Acetoacetate decarboxylase (ADC)
MGISARLRRQYGRFGLADGIPFRLPVEGFESPALFALFTIDADRARALLPGNELHPLRLWGNTGVLSIVVVNYEVTSIGSYVEFSVGIACTHGEQPAPRILPALLMDWFDVGQYVFDLPVSSEISVKGGKGIWGMPKHQANLDFVVGPRTISSQYDLDGQMVLRIDIPRPSPWLSVGMNSANFCAFRGMLWKSAVFFQGTFGLSFWNRDAKLTLGSHPRAAPLADLKISRYPLVTGFTPAMHGVLDDHVESWFLSSDQPPSIRPEGLESVANLDLSQAWLPPPNRPDGLSGSANTRQDSASWR